MLFHIMQTHTHESCPKDAGGSHHLYNADVNGVKLRSIYGAFAEHTIYYIVEADNMEAIHKFLSPGFDHCTCRITPVSEKPIVPKG